MCLIYDAVAVHPLLVTGQPCRCRVPLGSVYRKAGRKRFQAKRPQLGICRGTRRPIENGG